MLFNASNSSVYETALVCATCPVSMLMRAGILAWIHHYAALKPWQLFLVDFFSIVMPGILCMTIFSSYQDVFLTSLFCTACLFLKLLIEKRNPGRGQTDKDSEEHLLETRIDRRRNFMTYFRAYILLAAVIAILGVDFQKIFPRRFRKKKKYGVGLMDVGIGGFMVANGLVCKEVRPDFCLKSGVSQRVKHVLKVIRSTVPLWILGFLRATISWLTKYHVNPTEYGLYWNFFLTLAVVQILSTVLLTIFPPRYCPVLALVVGFTYQYVLQGLELRRFVLDNVDRKGFLNANREGIFSCVGHLALNLASAAVGQCISGHESRYKDWLKAFIQLMLIDSVFWITLEYLEPTVEPISRRMANLSYIAWMLAHQLFLLCGFLFVDLVEIAMKPLNLIKPSPIRDAESLGVTVSGFSLMEAINRNGLLFFVLANLLTGAVNLSMDAKNCPPAVGFLVLSVYMFILSAVAGLLHVRGITVTFC